ncbi:MAG: DUF2490 domain-containing protein [Saprospiraceae bacterium]|nr:DUF2490 domain-containing protein [Saprospiraceae bacterium]
MNNRQLKGVFLFLLLSFSNFALAQNTNTGNWINYFGNKKISEKWNWWHEVQFRNYNAVGDLEQLLIRTGLGYNISKTDNLHLGYAYVLSEPYISGTTDKNTIVEHRIYQQLVNRNTFGRGTFMTRLRFEERFISTGFKTRFRAMNWINYPINSKSITDKTVYLSAYHEIFLNGKGPTFDRLRLYGALGYFINKKIKVELGYLSQIQTNKSRGQFQMAAFANY